MTTYPLGLDIITSGFAPSRPPTPGEDARRIVRHGMAEVLTWLGEDVGPAPGDRIHTAFAIGAAALMNEWRAGLMVMNPSAIAVIKGLGA